MMPWSDAVNTQLLAYCRIDVLESGDKALLETLYAAAVSYLTGSGIYELEVDTPWRTQYDLCVNTLVLDSYDRRGTTFSGTALMGNPAFRGAFLQLQVMEPVSESDT